MFAILHIPVYNISRGPPTRSECKGAYLSSLHETRRNPRIIGFIHMSSAACTAIWIPVKCLLLAQVFENASESLVEYIKIQIVIKFKIRKTVYKLMIVFKGLDRFFWILPKNTRPPLFKQNNEIRIEPTVCVLRWDR